MRKRSALVYGQGRQYGVDDAAEVVVNSRFLLWVQFAQLKNVNACIAELGH